VKQPLLWIIKGYKKFFSPWLGNHCRFYPSCADYTSQAIARHGAVRGVLLGTKRLLKCHPFHEGGWDPVPEKFEVKSKWTQKS